VDAVAERQVSADVAANIEPVRRRVAARVAVRGADRDQHRLPRRDERAADLHRLRGKAERGVVDRAGVAEQFLHRAGQQRSVGAQPRHLARAEQQRQRPAADQVDRGLVPRHQQQEDHAQQLTLAEPVTGVTRGDQPGQQVVGGAGPLVRDQRGEIPGHLHRGRPGLIRRVIG
jgi:hypothetical protein